MSGIIASGDEGEVSATSEAMGTVQTWVPVVIAMITTIFFTTSSLLNKYLTDPKAMGFDSWKLSFASYSIVGFCLLLGLIYRAVSDPESFQSRMLFLGTFGSIINTFGIVLLNKAYSEGPLGPVAALTSIQSIMFSIVQAFIRQTVPLPLELFGSFIGLIGAFVLTIPEKMHSCFKFMLCLKTSEQQAKPNYRINSNDNNDEDYAKA